MKRNKSLLLSVTLLAGAALLVPAGPAQAADALAICNSGQPFLWATGGANIPFNPDQGNLRDPVPTIDNTTGVALVQQSFDNWTAGGPFAVPTSATYTDAGPLPVDVDISNFGPYLNPVAPDGYSAIVFDADGQIFDSLFGAGSGILGFAGPEWLDTVACEVIEGVSFLNGPAFDDLTAAEDVMTHEFGHYTNLGHVELNGQLLAFSEGGDDTGPTPDNTTFPPPASLAGLVETMYPFYFGPAAGTLSPHADDVASIATLYPGPTFAADTGSISGTIFAPNGTTRLSGVNVIARNIADPFADAVSTFSGAFTDSTSQADPNVGIFTLNNLTPGASYLLFVDEVTAQAGRFSNPILASLPGPEEYWNGGAESSDPDVDDPLAYEAIVASAGVDAGGTDIIFNGAAPGEIPLGDDDFAEIFMPFEFEICGQSYNSVFVNSNGNLTFGSGDTDFTESAGEFLSDQPRIAPLWDDLSPNAGGTVSWSANKNAFTVRFTDVPEYPANGANTFRVTLRRSSNQVNIVYGDLSSTDGLVGVSCGGAITSGFEQGEDLSASAPRTINLHRNPARYELFDFGNPGDLANRIVRFNGTTDYNDNWAEWNDNLKKSRSLALPFNSIPTNRYTEIEPEGDVDYYRFRGEGGKTLIAEILTSQLDTVMAVFDSSGTLVAFDDDGGNGVLSKVVYTLPATGRYYLGVATYDGTGTGRYVLDAYQADGFPLTLGDDSSQEVALPFTFSFNGTDYTSVFVNSNGNLTFGSGDTDFSESVGEFLSDQPRIAPLWDDLSPQNGGEVFVSSDAGSLTVSFLGVPEFISTGSNNFAVTLGADGSVTTEYGLVTALDGLVGVTEGNGAADPGESDLSAGGPFSAVGTTYEQFVFGDDFDLGGALIYYGP